MKRRTRSDGALLCIAQCTVSVALLMDASAFAQEEPSRLRYSVPKGWALDSGGAMLVSPEKNAVVNIGPSRAFVGTAAEWMTENWATTP